MSKKLYTADELRNKWIEFFKAKGHVDVGSASLIPENDPSVLFTTAGMHPLVPFLLGTPHLAGKRLCNVQKCIRTNDIDEVGDNCHLTFFEMMGNWSLGDYFKKEKTAWSYEFMTKELGLDPKKIETTLFEGDDSAPKDVISEAFLKDLGFDDKRIHFNPKEDNWWGLGQDNTPCGPDNEWFYPDAKGKLVEIGNDVYMQYVQYDGGKFKEKDSKCVDTGFGLERNLAFLNGATSAYVTELFSGVIAKLEELSGKKYYDIQEDEYTKSFRIVADHTRAATAILGDVRAIVPANGGAGYVLRRLIRKSVRHIRRLGVLEPQKIGEIALIYCEFFKNAYPEFWENREFIVSEFNKEEERFLKTLEGGEKEFDKLINGIE
ncbi:MAG: alanine--tRNA ligase, partial [Christensenellaceae bacterium]|nr:alanine--tRNA ligase [Christensenellaceae bacterium]